MNDCLAATGSDAIIPLAVAALLVLGGAVAFVIARRSKRSGIGTTLGLLLVIGLGISVGAAGGSAVPAHAADAGCEVAATASPESSAEPATPPPTTEPTPVPTDGPAASIVGGAPVCGILNDLVVPGERTAERYIAALEAIEPVAPEAVAASVPVVIQAQADVDDPDSLAADAVVAAQAVIDDYLTSACRIDGDLHGTEDRYYLYFSLNHLDYNQHLKLTTVWSSCIEPIVGRWTWRDLEYDLTTVFSGGVSLTTEVPFAQTITCAFQPTAFNFEYHVWAAGGTPQILQGVSGWSSGSIGPGDNSYGVCFDSGRIGTCEWTHSSSPTDHFITMAVGPAAGFEGSLD